MSELRSELMMELLSGGERFMVEALFVREVIAFRRGYRVPGSPSYLLGLTNFRGTVLPLASLAKLLGLPEDSSEIILVVFYKGFQLGLLGDKVLDVIPSYEVIYEEEVKLPDDLKPEFIKGAVRISGKPLFLIDIPAIFGEVFPASLSEKGE
jgi:purine-binding chemotaxis protein CheW